MLFPIDVNAQLHNSSSNKKLNESSSKQLRACFCLADGMVIFGKYFARLTEKFKAVGSIPF